VEATELQFSTRRSVIWKIESLKTSGIEFQAIKSVWVKSKARSWFHIPISLLRTPGITIPLIEPVLGGPIGGECLNGFVLCASCGRLGANATRLRGRIRDPTVGLRCHNSGERGSSKKVDVQPPFVIFFKPLFFRGFWSSEVTQPLGNHGAMAISEDASVSLGSGVVSPPLEVEKAVKTLLGILVVLIGIVRPLVVVFVPHWPVIRDPQTHETDLAVVNYKGARGSVMFLFGVEEVSIRSRGLKDLREGEVKVHRLDFFPSVRERGSRGVSNGKRRWPPDSSVCVGYGGRR
jgi:hypothetical protein